MISNDEIINVNAEEIGLTPGDLYQRRFRRALIGGYAMEDVDDFVEDAAEHVHELTQQIEDAESEKAALERKVNQSREVEATLRDALVNAHKYTENIVDSAKREADAIRERARAELERARLEAAQLPERLSREVRQLEEQRDRLRNELEAILETHRNLLRAQLDPAQISHESTEEPRTPEVRDRRAELQPLADSGAAPVQGKNEDIVELGDMIDDEEDA